MLYCRPLFILTFVLSSLVWIGGCSSDLGSVTGFVKVDGKPLENAKVFFQPSGGGRASSALTDANGNYRLQYEPNRPGAKIGSHIVVITSEFEDYNEEGELVVREEMLPKKYHDETELKAEVKAGGNVLNWDLKTK